MNQTSGNQLVVECLKPKPAHFTKEDWSMWEEKNPRTVEFLSTLKSPETAYMYKKMVCAVIADRETDKFLLLSRQDRESTLIKFILAHKARASSCQLAVSALSSFLTYCDLTDMNWKKIKHLSPRARSVALDRAPSKEEIKKLRPYCDPRLWAEVEVMSQTGCRVGALPDLTIKDYQKFDYQTKEENSQTIKLSSLRIYKGCIEEYLAVLTPEAIKAVDLYLDGRKRDGEILTPESPLFRDDYGTYTRNGAQVSTVNSPQKVTVDSIQSCISKAWTDSGVRTKKNGHYERHEFKECHGFRKFYKTTRLACKEHAQLDIEIDLGHYLSYYKPTFEHRVSEVIRSIPILAIDESEEIKLKSAEEMSRLELKYSNLEKKLSEITLHLALAGITQQKSNSESPVGNPDLPHNANTSPISQTVNNA